MNDKLRLMLAGHGKAMWIAFELFWIAVFILDRLGGTASTGIPDFVYVNY
jgi:hypothetical protein